METTEKLDSFTLAYLECALWAEIDNATPNGGEPLDANHCIADFVQESIDKAVQDCKQFQEENAELLSAADYGHPEYTDDEMAGHDFWLTRNSHGAGFWDRELGDVGDKLSEAAKAYGESDIYVGDNGALYLT